MRSHCRGWFRKGSLSPWEILMVGKKKGKGILEFFECICGLAAAVTDLLQSVQLEYNGYEGDTKDSDANKGATKDEVTNHLNGLFSLVQGLGGTAVVRTYIDQLAQVLSALVGWSSIVKCNGDDRNGCKGTDECKGGSGSGGTCKYLEDVVRKDRSCDTCGCIKGGSTEHLGRGCQRCKGSGTGCNCSTPGSGSQCAPGQECKCALAGKCCKCCCKGCSGKCNEKGCICDKEKKDTSFGDEYRIHSYTSAYPYKSILVQKSFFESKCVDVKPFWRDLTDLPDYYPGSASQRRHQCAQILLGSVCLIWSGITYMYWTGKYHKSSPRWNNHILDGSGLDDGTLSQWLQALGFPKDMLNNHGPGNRMDAVIWDGLSDKFFLGFKVPSGLFGSGVHDNNDNTARKPAGMNYPGFIHTIHRDSFNKEATVFRKNGSGSSTTDTNMHKYGALFKLYILSCAYFTGLQKKTTESNSLRHPKTIREILYWLSALPYSTAYPEILKHGKDRLREVLKKPDGSSSTNNETQLKFYQDKRPAPITVDEYNLFAHFQAVTQYCPLVLIGIQGGLHSTNSTTPAIHSLYANTECRFTYPTVSIQAYNQVVHYIRALFYQLYFLRKQCAVKVTCGGKWRECRYGDGVVSKGVISWMCLGCDPMEHDRKSRVGKVKGELVGVKTGEAMKVKDVLSAIGDVVVQLGNAQEALEGKKTEAIEKVKEKLTEAKKGLEEAKEAVKQVKNGGLNGKLQGAKEKLGELTTNGGSSGALHKLANGNGAGSLQQIVGSGQEWQKDYSSAKDRISEAINGVYKALDLIKGWAKGEIEKQKKAKKDLEHVIKQEMSNEYTTLLNAINQLISICNTAQCPGCKDHAKKCGKPPVSRQCPTCHQQYMDGFPSPLQAFLEDRLPGFSCSEVLYTEDTDKYPPAASHLGHCNGSGQCCPLPMGFRGHFHGGIRDCTGARLYGILYFFSNGDMMQSCVYTLVRVTAALNATTPQVLGDVFGFFRGGVGEKEQGKNKKDSVVPCDHTKDPSTKGDDDYFCGWCASGLREEVRKIEWIPKGGDSDKGGKYRGSVGEALINIKDDKGSGITTYSSTATANTSLSRLTKNCQYLSPLTGELYTAVSATFGNTYLSWVLYLSDALQWGLQSLASEFLQIECRGCKGQCDPNKCKKGEHGQKSDAGSAGLCQCQSIVSCTGVLPVLYRHGFSYGNPFNLEGYEQKDGETEGDYSITQSRDTKHCHEFLDSLSVVINAKKESDQKDQDNKHPLTELLKQVGKLQYDIRLPWIFVLTLAWLVAVLYLAFGAIWPLDWTHMRSHWLRGGAHQWQCMWYKVMTGRKGMELVEYFGRRV